MSTLKVNTVLSADTPTVNVTDGLNVTGVSTVTTLNTTNIVNSTPLSHRNKVINGDMRIAQRATTSNAVGYVTIDRFSTDYGGEQEAMAYSQADISSGSPYEAGFAKSFKVQNGNQTSGAGASDYIKFNTKLEAQDIANSGWNYKSASSFITLSYWVKSSVAQTFFVRVTALDSPVYNFPFSYSVSANTWTKVTKAIPGNSNLVFNNDNGTGLDIEWTLFRGTNTTGSGATLDTWAAYDSSQRQPDNTSTWYTTNDATWEITGVQLEVGDTATTFEHRSFGDELARCQRYFQVLSRNTSAGLNQHSRYPALGNGTNSTLWYCYHKQTMRVRPSLVTSNITSTTVEIFNYSTSSGATYGGSSMSEGDENHSQITVTTTGGVSSGNVACWRFKINGDCYWAVSAEL